MGAFDVGGFVVESGNPEEAMAQKDLWERGTR